MQGHATALHPDGRVLTAGRDGSTFALVARGPGGTPIVSKSLPVGASDGGAGVSVARARAILADGRIRAAGSSDKSGSGTDLALVRCTSDLALDPTFSGAGATTAHLTAANGEEARGLALLCRKPAQTFAPRERSTSVRGQVRDRTAHREGVGRAS